MGKPESHRTDEERAKLERAKTDPTIQKAMPWLNEQRLNGHDRLEPTVAAQAGREVSVDAGADEFAAAADKKGYSALNITKAPSPTEPMTSSAVPAAPMPKAAAGLTL